MTLNEENFIGKLLASIKKQNIFCEVILVDAMSEDKTIEIAQKTFPKIRIIKSAKRNPAYQRNLGVKAANGNILLFIDADVILPNFFLINALSRFKLCSLDLANPFSKPSKNILLYKLLYYYNNKIVKYTGYGACLFAKRKVFDKIGYFNTRIGYGEDCNFINRAKKHFKYGTIDETIIISTRRVEKMGFLPYIYVRAKYAIFRIGGECYGLQKDYKFNGKIKKEDYS